MTPASLADHWVEVREEGAPGRHVLRPFTAPIPPARGRRALVLHAGGAAEARSPGPADATTGAPGRWQLDDGTLTLDAPGWSGRYTLGGSGPDRLVLTRV